MSGNMTPEAAEAHAKWCAPEICDECDLEYPECNHEPEDCEGQAAEQATEDRFEAMRDSHD